MWIIMNNDIFGFIALCAFASPVIGLAIIIAFKINRKIRPSQAKIQAEKRPERKLEEQSKLHKSASPQRAIVGFIATTILVALAGSLVGIIASIFSHLIYIVFVFPLMMGVVGGNTITGAIRLAKIRKSSQLIFLSLLATTTIYGTFHYGRYVGLQVQTSLEVFPGLSQATEAKNLRVAKALVDYALEKETGYSGFVGYMLFKAKDGVSIGRFYQSNRLNLGSILTWVYWTMEFGVILWVAIHMGKKLVRMSFCEFCGNWYGKEKHLGGTTLANQVSLLDLINKKDFIELGRLMEENAELPSLEIYLQGCEVCNKSHSHLVVRHALQGPRGGLQFTDASKIILQPQESVLLLDQLKFIGN
jgi:hypothetical protein